MNVREGRNGEQSAMVASSRSNVKTRWAPVIRFSKGRVLVEAGLVEAGYVKANTH